MEENNNIPTNDSPNKTIPKWEQVFEIIETKIKDWLTKARFWVALAVAIFLAGFQCGRIFEENKQNVNAIKQNVDFVNSKNDLQNQISQLKARLDSMPKQKEIVISYQIVDSTSKK